MYVSGASNAAPNWHQTFCCCTNSHYGRLRLLDKNEQKAMAGMGLIAAFNSQPSLLQLAIESLTVVNSSC
jgi:hypothetical protein